MARHSKRPGKSDAVLGGRAIAPAGGVVLGGVAGVQQRLRSQLLDQRLGALTEALQHGQAGLDLLILALEDPVEAVQQRAYELLRDRSDPAIQAALHRFLIATVKRQLTSSDVDQRIDALTDALDLGEAGLNLVIQKLRDPADAVQKAAFLLLKDHPEPRVQKAIALFSSQGISYTRLRDLLAARNWRLADQETRKLLYKGSGLQPTDVTRFPLFADFPCEDLQMIDHLWLQYSNGRFGFSVQQPIWHHYHQTFWDKTLIWSTFGDRVGWRVNHVLKPNHWKRYDELTFTIEAPPGHLPHLGDRFGIFTIEAIANRIAQCDL